MLFNVLLCVLTAYAIASPYFYARALKTGIKHGKSEGAEELRQWKEDVLKEYKALLNDYENAIRFGIEIGNTPEKQPPFPMFNVPEDKPKPKMTPSEERTMQILENIDRYDGTSKGQKRVNVNGQ